MTTPTPSEDLTEAEIEEMRPSADPEVTVVRVTIGKEKYNKMLTMALRAISLPKGERPKRPAQPKLGTASEGHWSEYFSAMRDYAFALESYADQLEAKLNGGK